MDGKQGSLAVEGSSAIIPVILQLLDRKWPVVVASRDWHPAGHISFASSHSGSEPFTKKDGQDLWPDHCVQGSSGAEIEKRVGDRLRKLKHDGTLVHYVEKGSNPKVDAYSAFASDESPDPDPETDESPLADYLHVHGVVEVYCAGLATDYCVAATAKASQRWGFETYVLTDAIRAVGGDGGTEKTLDELRKQGIKTMLTTELPDH